MLVGWVQGTTGFPTTVGRAVAALLIGSGCTTEKSLQELDAIRFKVKAAQWCEYLGINCFEALTCVLAKCGCRRYQVLLMAIVEQAGMVHRAG